MQNSQNTLGYAQNPNWRLGLARIHELLCRLENPEKNLRFIHVAGTNGKGSTSAMLASVLCAAGYKTGLFTSPVLLRFEEHIQVNGEAVSPAALSSITARVCAAAKTMQDPPTEFELLTAAALLYFSLQKCTVVVVEVGLGGREDATNVIPPPDVAVITPISIDHTSFLGDTLPEIAFQKGGIIKPGCTVVCAPQEPAAEHVLSQIAAENNTKLNLVQAAAVKVHSNTLNGQIFDFYPFEKLHLPLLGSYQPLNAATALTAVLSLRSRGWDIPDSAVYNGLLNVRWPARFELVQKQPPVIVDGGHNTQGALVMAQNLKYYFPGCRVHFIIGVMADKDFPAMFSEILPFAGRVFTVTPDNPRALPAKELAQELAALGFKDITACSTVAQAVEKGLSATREGDVLCAFGTLYMAGAVRLAFGLEQP